MITKKETPLSVSVALADAASTAPTAPLPSLKNAVERIDCLVKAATVPSRNDDGMWNTEVGDSWRAIKDALLAMQRERDDLRSVLERNGFVRCDIMACNCGSWHHRYGLRERMDEIKDALTEAEVLNNETGNLPLRAVNKLIEQRQQLREQLAASERTCAELRADNERMSAETLECAQIIGAAICELAGIPPDEGLHIGHLPDMCRDYVQGSQEADWQLEAACEHWKRRATELARLEGEGTAAATTPTAAAAPAPATPESPS